MENTLINFQCRVEFSTNANHDCKRLKWSFKTCKYWIQIYGISTGSTRVSANVIKARWHARVIAILSVILGWKSFETLEMFILTENVCGNGFLSCLQHKDLPKNLLGEAQVFTIKVSKSQSWLTYHKSYLVTRHEQKRTDFHVLLQGISF